jgi:hypothetical protein
MSRSSSSKQPRHGRPAPSREEATATLQQLARRGLIKFNDLDAATRRAVLLHWGSMSRARADLGLRQLEPPRQVWSRKRVVDEMKRLHRSGQHMSCIAVIKAGRNDLVVAAHRYVGSWARARELAGIRFERHRPRAAQAWDATTVVETISERHRLGQTLASSKVPRALILAATRIFGSWRDAIEAAGLDYEAIILTRRYSDEEILDWLRHLARTRPRMTLFDLDKHGEHAVACRRRWGSYEAAATAAGIEEWPIRLRHRSMSRIEVIQALRARHASKLPLHISAVRKSEGGHTLILSVLHHFTSWDKALSVARVPRQRKSFPFRRNSPSGSHRRKHRV